MEEGKGQLSDEKKRQVADRILAYGKEYFKLYLSLSVGSIVVIAAFLREPPPFAGGKWLVLSSLLCFFVSFWAFFAGLKQMTALALDIERSIPLSHEKAEEHTSVLQWSDKIGPVFFFVGVVLLFIFALGVVLSW